jgi:hypothetical protein
MTRLDSRLGALERRTTPADDPLLRIIERNDCPCGPCTERHGQTWTCARTGEPVFTLTLDSPKDDRPLDELDAA